MAPGRAELLSLAPLRLCDGALELGAGGEPRRAASGDVDRLAGARVARLAGGALGDREPPEPSDRHFAAAGQLGFDRGQRRIDGARGLTTRESGAIGDLLDELALVHPRPPPLDGLGGPPYAARQTESAARRSTLVRAR